MSEAAPAYVTELDQVWPKAEILARVFGITRDELVARAVSDGLDALLEDDDVRAAFHAIQAIAARSSRAKRPGPVAAAAAPAPASAGATSQPVWVEVNEPDEDPDGDEDVEQHRRGAKREAKPVITAAERQRAASHVKAARLRRGLSQQEVAEVLGISNATVSLVERAGHNVALATLRAVVAWASAPDADR